MLSLPWFENFENLNQVSRLQYSNTDSQPERPKPHLLK